MSIYKYLCGCYSWLFMKKKTTSEYNDIIKLNIEYVDIK